MNLASNNFKVPQGTAGTGQGNDAIPLLHFSQKDVLTVKQSFEGIFVAGQSGSGKTSGPGQGLARAMLRNQYGFLITTTKPDDATTWVEWARREGREDDVRLFSPENDYCFGLLDYAYHQAGTRGGSDTENVVALLSDLLEVKNRNRGSAGDQQFWIDSMRKMLGHFIDLLAFSGQTISFAGVAKILNTVPQNMQEVQSKEWQEKSYANQLVDRAVANKKLTAAQESDLGLALEYVLSVLPRMEERLRSGIMATLDSITYPFLRGRLAALCDGKTNICPEDCFRGDRAAILILDLPVKLFHMTGLFIQILFRRLWQQAAEKRDTKKHPRPLCLFCDEGQNFCTKYDALFQATARSARVSSVFMTQNLDSLQSQIGKPDTEALLGNFNLKIMCSTDHMPTAEWAAKKIGESWALGSNASVSLGNQGSASGGVSEQRRFIVEPSEFVRLRKGGDENNFMVDGIAFRSGRPFEATGMNHIRVQFPQKLNA